MGRLQETSAAPAAAACNRAAPCHPSHSNSHHPLNPAAQTAAANEQHYEVPTAYFLKVLGRHLKYSSCIYATPQTTLDEAEQAMLGALRCAACAGLGWATVAKDEMI